MDPGYVVRGLEKTIAFQYSHFEREIAFRRRKDEKAQAEIAALRGQVAAFQNNDSSSSSSSDIAASESMSVLSTCKFPPAPKSISSASSVSMVLQPIKPKHARASKKHRVPSFAPRQKGSDHSHANTLRSRSAPSGTSSQN